MISGPYGPIFYFKVPKKRFILYCFTSDFCSDLFDLRWVCFVSDLNKKQTLIDAAPGSNNPFRDVSATAGVIGGQRRHDIASQSGRW